MTFRAPLCIYIYIYIYNVDRSLNTLKFFYKMSADVREFVVAV